MKVDFSKLDRAFSPRVVAVVGDKSESNYLWLNGQLTFKGKLYSVQVDPKEIEGIKALGVENYASLLDVPEAVDLVIVAVPRSVAPRILEDCIRKDVAAAHFFTAGFTETETEEGTRLERQLVERAKQANFHLIGPNCMGLFNPKAGIRQAKEQYTGVAGPVGFISQSGTHAINFSLEAHFEGLDINKSVSFGNGRVLDAADFLEYFGADPEIKAIGMYLEGTRDGERFLRVLKDVSDRKPVVIWKGGRTEEGGRAIASHTGSLAVPQTIWDSAVKQCGAMKVDNVYELIDTLKALVYLPPVRGDRVGITGGSGGQSVAVADVVGEAGLKAPQLTQESYDELTTFYTLIGGGYRNPVDTGNVNRREIKRIMEILERDANVDNLMLLLWTRLLNSGQLENHINAATDIRKTTSKPVLAVVSWNFSPKEVQLASDIIQKLQGGGVPAFLTLERGAKALRNALDYYRMKNSVGNPP